METKILMSQFIEALKRKGVPYKKKEIKLRKMNRIKFCIECNEVKEIEMHGKDGHCPSCEIKLYSVDCRSEKFR